MKRDICSVVSGCVSGVGSKITFGAGIHLTVHTNEEEKPAYYQLKDEKEDDAACLATGFTRHNATAKTDGFMLNQTSEAVRASGDPDYSQVMLGKCPDTVTEGKACADDIEPDPKLRFLSVTVTWLRLIFIKAIAFNGLMTLRVWMG